MEFLLMSAKIIDGIHIARSIQQDIQQELENVLFFKPSLTVILVGDNAASKTYIRMKQKACAAVGIHSELIHLPSEISEEELVDLIKRLNEASTVNGILVQLPLPKHINSEAVMESISPLKDVDGLHPINMGKLLSGRTDCLVPCTPKGIIQILKQSQIEIAGKHVVIVGRSNIVGKPLGALLMQKSDEGNATVTIAHSYTQNLEAICLSADILVAAIGQPNFIKKEMVKPGAIVIDVGVNKITDPKDNQKTKLVGDVDFTEVAPICSVITPVPGGVGPMTIAMLLSNTLHCFKLQKKLISPGAL
ncbi:MAG: folD [Chlamydiales bacterium]|jgi:methylenetetrahydrofolate dehydrogenase (NADP+)/methenyltetrahydrofolate cyclohydrolase|nr:folD [Chlamydiales bacterium]